MSSASLLFLMALPFCNGIASQHTQSAFPYEDGDIQGTHCLYLPSGQRLMLMTASALTHSLLSFDFHALFGFAMFLLYSTLAMAHPHPCRLLFPHELLQCYC